MTEDRFFQIFVKGTYILQEKSVKKMAVLYHMTLDELIDFDLHLFFT
mgnify:CR=1